MSEHDKVTPCSSCGPCAACHLCEDRPPRDPAAPSPDQRGMRAFLCDLARDLEQTRLGLHEIRISIIRCLKQIRETLESLDEDHT